MCRPGSEGSCAVEMLVSTLHCLLSSLGTINSLPTHILPGWDTCTEGLRRSSSQGKEEIGARRDHKMMEVQQGRRAVMPAKCRSGGFASQCALTTLS